MTRFFPWMLVLAVVLAAPWPDSAAGQEPTLRVDSTADAVDANPGDGVCADASGGCTLRAAIQEANAVPGPIIVHVDAGTYTLAIPGAEEDAAATGDLDITDDLIIEGAFATCICVPDVELPYLEVHTIVNGGGMDRVFHIIGEISVEISGLRITAGDSHTQSFGQGGGIHNPYGTLSVYASIFEGNNAAGGGAVYNGGNASLQEVIVRSNQGTAIMNDGSIYDTAPLLRFVGSVAEDNTGGDGGAIWNGMDGRATIHGSVFRRNTAGLGGAIANIGEMQVLRSVIENNIAPGGAGGLRHALGEALIDGVAFIGNEGTPGGGMIVGAPSEGLVIVNSTFANNRAPSQPGPFGITPGTGGAIRVDGPVTIRNTTISGNTAGAAGAGLHILDGTASLHNTIVAGNTADEGVENCNEPVESLGHNLEDTSSCGFTVPGDLSHIAPLLGEPPENSFGSFVYPLLPGSPAIDAGDDAQCPATDQAGQGRPRDGDGDGEAVCDIGAYEVQSYVAPSPSPTAAPIPSSSPAPAVTPAALPQTGRPPAEPRTAPPWSSILPLASVPVALAALLAARKEVRQHAPETASHRNHGSADRRSRRRPRYPGPRGGG